MRDMIDMAREAGGRAQQNKNCDVEYVMSSESLQRLIEIVRADEREQFFTPEEARVALEDTDFTWHQVVTQEMVEKLEAIRARGKA